MIVNESHDNPIFEYITLEGVILTMQILRRTLASLLEGQGHPSSGADDNGPHFVRHSGADDVSGDLCLSSQAVEAASG